MSATDLATSVAANGLSSRLDLEENARKKLRPLVARVVESTPAFDTQTHLYAPSFHSLLRCGIDQLLTQRELLLETARCLEIPTEMFWTMPAAQQADLVWQHLFARRSPLSHAACGVVSALHSLGIDTAARDLQQIRAAFEKIDTDQHIGRCLELAGVHKVCMTNSPFNDDERELWQKYSPDSRFVAGLCINPLLHEWTKNARWMYHSGYQVQSDLGAESAKEVRRFLEEWSARMSPAYLVAELPASFDFPSSSAQSSDLLENAVLPFCQKRKMPLFLLSGLRRPPLAAQFPHSNGVAKSNLVALENLLIRFPDNKFVVSAASRENQHELCTLATRHRNLHVAGAWWLLNGGALENETLRMRLEMLGSDFTAQFSGAQVFEQLIGAWQQTRALLTEVLLEKYTALALSGWHVSAADVERDAQELLGGSFERFVQL